MADETFYLLYLDDYHGADLLFLQSLSRALAKKAWKPAPMIVHGSGEHAERLMEAHGIFRSRAGGVLEIRSAREHALMEQALRELNQKIVALLTDAVVSSIGVIGSQRNVFVVRGGDLHVPGTAWLHGIAGRGVVSVIAANARDESTDTTGEIALTSAVSSLTRRLEVLVEQVVIVFFTKTNLPGVMRGGMPRETVGLTEQALRQSVSDWASLAELVSAGLPVLLTNTNRLSDGDGPTGSRILPSA